MYPGRESFDDWIKRNQDVLEQEQRETCPECNGKKVVIDDDFNESKCDACKGKGYFIVANKAEKIYYECYWRYFELERLNRNAPLRLGMT